MVSLALVLGVVGQMLSVRTGFPNIVFFLIFGVLVGPEFLSLVHPSEFGDGLNIIIKLCVAIVLFEAGLNLKREEAADHGNLILLLITAGALITMVGGALLAYYLTDLSLEMAFLYGSLVIVTGPTVIQPLLRRFRIRSNLKNILEYEGVLIDPVGALVAFFVLEIILVETEIAHVSKGLLLVGYKFVVGTIIGLVGGYLATLVVKKFYIYMEDFVDLFILACALTIYEVSEILTPDAGLVSAIISGAIVGNLNIPEEENMRKFKGKLTILVISLLFIFLAANLELNHIQDIGIYSVLVVLGLLFLVRPVQIFLLTLGSKLSIREKAFLSFISPRGIIAASIASFIAIELDHKDVAGGGVIQGLVFLTIAISVLLQGTTTGFVSRFLGVTDTTSKVVIVGAHRFGRLLARLFEKHGKEVWLVDTNTRFVELSRSENLNVVEGDSMDTGPIEKTGFSSADTIISLTTSDHVNVLTCRLVRIDFKTENTYALLNSRARASDAEEMTKFKIPLAFGRQVDVMDVYSKILHEQHVVFSFRAEKKMKGTFEPPLPDHMIPLIVERAKEQDIVVYHEGVTIEAGDRITMLDIDPVSTSPDVIKWTDKELITL